jgi:outer membrane protein OmpA-like peptidoglycan-associated protein
MWSRIALSSALTLMLGACGAETRVVLLDSDQPEALTITNDAGVTELDKPGQAVELSSRQNAPKPLALSDADIKKDWGDAIAYHPAEPTMSILYFNFDSADFTERSRGDVKKLIDAIRARVAAEVEIIGYTDRSGPESYNRDLGLRRAEAVRRALTAAGIPASAISVESYGANDPLVESHQPYEPRNRRAEITLR